MSIIAERKLYHERTNGRYLKNLENDKETETEDAEVIGIMLDLLIAAQQDNLLTDLDIKEEVDTDFIFEIHMLYLPEQSYILISTEFTEIPIFDQIQKYLMDRFLPERMQNRHPYSYIPFSAGPRNCIGQRFGVLELKAMIAPLVHNFNLEPIDCLKDIQLQPGIIMHPSHPVYVKFNPINRE